MAGDVDVSEAVASPALSCFRAGARPASADGAWSGERPGSDKLMRARTPSRYWIFLIGGKYLPNVAGWRAASAGK